MVGPRRQYVRALVATCAVGAGLALGSLPATDPSAAATGSTSGTTGGLPAAADPALVDDAPLAVAISSMTPGSLPARGDIVLTGTVTNRTDETWSSIDLFAIAGDRLGDQPVEPMRNQGQLEQAMATPYDEVVGERITDRGTFGEVDELAPGVTAGWTVVVPADAVEVTSPGVYWFGVHALGSSPSVPDDKLADGRARTFLPFVPRRFDVTPLSAALVVPLTHRVRYTAEGAVDDVDTWVDDLDSGGLLTRLLRFVETSPDPVTWLVDPALVDAVSRLAAGNAPRDLGPVATDPPTDPPTGQPEGGASADPVEPVELGSTASPSLSDSARVATDWLARFTEVVRGDEVLALPYGNIDLPATLAHRPELLRLALAQRSTALRDLGVDAAPVIASPNGYLDAATIRAADPGSRILVTDQMFGTAPPAAADAEGHRLLVTSYGATQGSPGPAPSLTTVGLRQRLLAEAAVRIIKNRRQPLVVVLPLDWELDGPTAYFDGLDVPWLDLGTVQEVAAVAAPTAVSPDDLFYRPRQERRELDASTVDAVAGLIEAGDSLQSMLVDNTEIGGTLTEEALTGLSYAVRADQTVARLATGRARQWVDAKLSGVRISASPGVTLSSSDGQFVVNLTNTLDHRVAVSVRAESDPGIEVVAPRKIVLPPGGRDTVLLTASTTTGSVHNVTLMVTDPSGRPLGSTAELPIRPTQVSGVIWLILGTGAGLLLLAVVVRLARRVGAARRGEPGAGRRGTRATVEAV